MTDQLCSEPSPGTDPMCWYVEGHGGHHSWEHPPTIDQLRDANQALTAENARLREERDKARTHVTSVERSIKHAKERARRAGKTYDENIRAISERLDSLIEVNRQLEEKYLEAFARLEGSRIRADTAETSLDRANSLLRRWADSVKFYINGDIQAETEVHLASLEAPMTAHDDEGPLRERIIALEAELKPVRERHGTVTQMLADWDQLVDENDRLREALDEMTKERDEESIARQANGFACAEYRQAFATVETELVTVTRRRDDWAKDCKEAWNRLETVEIEIARLREALKEATHGV